MEGSDDTRITEILTTIGRMDGRQEGLVKTTERIETAIFGNGKPGLRADVEALGFKVKDIDQRLVAVEDRDCTERIEEIEERHQEEDETKGERMKRRSKEQDSFRNFRWALIFMAATMIINFIMRILEPHAGWIQFLKGG
jgi:hypothetical protein